MNAINYFFRIQQNHSSISTELFAGLTTFLAMSYILLVCPSILSQAGMDTTDIFIATCLTCCVGSVLTALLSNYPIANGPSVALLVFFSYSVVISRHYDWQTALGAVVIAGILLALISLSSIRKVIIEAIPHSLQVSFPIGIGLFLALVALTNNNIILLAPFSYPHWGNIFTETNLFFIFGLIVIILLNHFRIRGAIIISILSTTVLSVLLGKNHFQGIINFPHTALSQTFFAFNFHHLMTQSGIIIIFTFLLVSLFDTTGTILGVIYTTHLVQDPKKTIYLSRSLLANGLSSMFAGVIGIPTTISFIESAAGIQEGGRTGLTAITVALFFLLAIFFSPLAKTVPHYAVGPTLLYIGCLMITYCKKLPWKDFSESIPALLSIIAIPITFSIADSIGVGFISYVVMKLIYGKFQSLNMTLVILAILFLLFFIFHL